MIEEINQVGCTFDDSFFFIIRNQKLTRFSDIQNVYKIYFITQSDDTTPITIISNHSVSLTRKGTHLPLSNKSHNKMDLEVEMKLLVLEAKR